MKKLNISEICAAYNTARKQNGSREMDYEHVIRELTSYGISKASSIKLVRNGTFFIIHKKEGMGKGRHITYSFSNDPIHISLFEKAFYGKEEKADIPFEEECINYLKSLGYKIYKPEGFNLKVFKNEHPEMFEKYLTVKEV